MALDRAGFELMLLHARLLPELALAQLAQEILDTPRDGAKAALAMTTSAEASGPAIGDAVDWFGTAGLSDADLREIRASAERELAAFAASSHAPTPARADADPPGPGLDLAHELALAYAQRPAIAPLAAAAFERVDRARLEVLLADVAGAAAPLTATQDAEDLAVWLMLVEDDDPALAALLRCVRDAADGA